MADAARGVPRLRPDRRRAHRVRVRHQREQGRQPRPRRVFHLYALVGETERPVRTSPILGFLFCFCFCLTDERDLWCWWRSLGRGFSCWGCLV